MSIVIPGLVVIVLLMVVAVVTPVLAERTPRARAFVHRRSVAGRRPGGVAEEAPPREVARLVVLRPGEPVECEADDHIQRDPRDPRLVWVLPRGVRARGVEGPRGLIGTRIDVLG